VSILLSVPRLRPLLLPCVIIAAAAAIYVSRVRYEMVDFAVYRTAAARAVSAESLYRADDGHYQFKYLPAFALAMTPFAVLDVEAAKTLWFALSVGFLTMYVRWSVRVLPAPRRSERVLGWLAVLFMAKFYAHELALGQTNVLLGVLLVGALLASQIDQPLVAGVLVGAAAFVKPYALMLLPWLAIAQGMQAAGATLVVVAAGLVAPALVYGWQGNVALLTDWFRAVATTTEPNLLGADNISIAAMWAKWLGPGSAAATLATVSIGLLLGLGAAAWAWRRRVDEPDYLEVALLMLFVPLVSPQGWDYVLLLATPGVICLIDRWPEMTTPWRTTTAAALVLTSFTVFDLMGRSLYGQFMALSIVSVAALALVASLVQLRWRALA
jgi:hypothetical protein